LNTIADSKMLDQKFDEAVKGRRFPLALMTIILCIGACIAFAHNTTPAPFFDTLYQFYSMDPVRDQAAMNLSLSIVFPFFIAFSLFGTMLERKIGTRNMLTLFMLIVSIGVLLTFVSSTYVMYLVSRCIFGIGFGLHIPTFGSAIAKWYRPKAREFMTALYGVFPLLGALVCYATFPVVAEIAGSWQMGAAYTGIISLVAVIIWIAVVRKDVDDINLTETQNIATGMIEEADVKGSIFGWLLKQREMKSIMVTFACDFTVYAYIATILPLWLMVSGDGMSVVKANTWAAIAFPMFGVIGVIIGATTTTKLGLRKPVIVTCQVVKLLGCMIAALFCDQGVQFVIIGAALFGLGNGGWMSAMFLVPTELKGTNSSRVAGGWSIILSVGYVFGFIMPVIGGALATAFALKLEATGVNVGTNALQAYGFKWSFFILGLSHVIAIIAASTLRETGPGRKKKIEAPPTEAA
jgi:MFS family permease